MPLLRRSFYSPPRIPTAVIVALSLSLLSGCGGSNNTSVGMRLTDVNLPAGATWQINREVEFKFSAEVDFETVNPNTIEIRQHNGVGAVGEFSMDPSEPNIVKWQPACPREADYSDAGLQPSTDYRMIIRGASTSSVTLADKNGMQLAEGLTIEFQTSGSSDVSELFFDQVPGPPVPLVRSEGSGGVGTYVEFGGDPDSRVYFVYNSEGEGLLVGGGLRALELVQRLEHSSRHGYRVQPVGKPLE